jgi:1,4-alpha-glucan branching enzyme
VADLNRLYREEAALHVLDFDPSGFEWIDCNDSQHSVVSLLRKAPSGRDDILAVFNFTPVPRHGYRVGAPNAGFWKEVLNSDAAEYGGSGMGNLGGKETEEVLCHSRPWSLDLTLPPLGAVFFKIGERS